LARTANSSVEPVHDVGCAARHNDALRFHRADIRRVVEINGARNPRVFGSALHGNDTGESDLDLLVDPIDGRTTLTSLVRIKREIEALTGVATDVLTPMALHERFRDVVLAEAVPV
jgi:predicted nucleotidyltransferase